MHDLADVKLYRLAIDESDSIDAERECLVVVVEAKLIALLRQNVHTPDCNLVAVVDEVNFQHGTIFFQRRFAARRA